MNLMKVLQNFYDRLTRLESSPPSGGMTAEQVAKLDQAVQTAADARTAAFGARDALAAALTGFAAKNELGMLAQSNQALSGKITEARAYYEAGLREQDNLLSTMTGRIADLEAKVASLQTLIGSAGDLPTIEVL